MCGSSGQYPSAPPMSDEEKSLIAEQKSLISKQKELFDQQLKQTGGATDLDKALSGFYDTVVTKKGTPGGKKTETVFNDDLISSYKDVINREKNAPGRLAQAPLPDWVKDKLGQAGYDINRSYDENNQHKGSEKKDPAEILADAAAELRKSPSRWSDFGLATTQESDVAATPDETGQVINQEKAAAYRSKLDKQQQQQFDYQNKMYEMLNDQAEVEKQFNRIRTLTAERQEKALKGELPLSAATQQQKLQEFQQLKENVARNGGAIEGATPETAVARGTAGTQALGEFARKWGLVEDAERRGEISSGGSAVLSQYGLTSDIASRNVAAGGALKSYSLGTPQFGGGGYGDVASGYGSLFPQFQGLQSTYANQRGLEYGGLLQQYGQGQQNQSGMYNMYGQLAGSVIAGLASRSSRTFKKDILEMEPEEEDKSLSLVSKGKVYRWNYKEEGAGPRRHMSLMAEEAPKDIVTQDGKHLDIPNYLGLLTSSLKALNRKVESLSLRAA